MISGTMPRWQKNFHALGFGVMCAFFAGLGLFSLYILIQTARSPGAGTPPSEGLLVASLVMIAVTSSGIGAQVWFRRRIVKEFTYNGGALRFSTLGTQAAQSRDITEIAAIEEWQGRGGAQGYRLRFADGLKIYLQYGVTNCLAVAEQMRWDRRRTL